jgi:MFS family permease
MSLWILAALLAVTTIPLHALVLRRSPTVINSFLDGQPLSMGGNSDAVVQGQRLPSATSSGSTVKTALRDVAFWWLSLAFSLSTLSSVALAVHLLPYLSLQGYPASFAALTVSVLGGSQIPGRLIFGPLSSRISLRLVTALLFTLMTAGLLILLAAPMPRLILLGAALYGMGSGASSPARAALVGEFYGIANYGAINGIMALVQTLVRSGAPLAMGFLYTWTGGYTTVFWVLILCAATAVGAVLAARKSSLG